MHRSSGRCVFLFLLVLGLGCGRRYQELTQRASPTPNVLVFADAPGTSKPLHAASWDGVFRGRVIYKGGKDWLKASIVPKEKPECRAGKDEAEERKHLLPFHVGPEDGLAEVVICFRHPSDHVFLPTPDALRKRDHTVAVDMPYCAFRPRVVLHFAAFRTPEGWERTGERFVFRNSGEVLHNPDLLDGLTYAGATTPSEPWRERNLAPRFAPIPFACSIHPWMKGAVWVLDHPFAAVTDARGCFEIRGLPIGVDLHFIAWHPMAGFFLPNGAEGQRIRLTAGENRRDLILEWKDGIEAGR